MESATMAGARISAIGRKMRFSVVRSRSRPTVNWVAAPQSVTAKARAPTMGRSRSSPASPPSLWRRLEEPRDAEGGADQARHQEGRAPAGLLRQERRHDGREGDAEVAE